MRIHLKRFLRTAFICVVFLFILLNMHVMMYIAEEPQEYNHRPQHHNIAEAHVQFGTPDKSIELSHSLKESSAHVFVYPSSAVNLSNAANRIKINTSNIAEIKEAILRINQKQDIFNIDKFGLRLDADSTVIVVQVHDRGEYLKILLDSLRKVRNIRNTLVVISHDFYSEDLNDIVLSVDFCPVMQIFFPYSLQTYPNEFPGFHPNDCPRNMKKEEALKKNCNNAHYPDKYGHYREPKYSQTKHHWFWKLQHVFERINVLKKYVGNVLLLEEDYYVVEDAIFILQMLQNFKNKECKECKILALGNYDKTQNFKINAGKVENALWISSKHNMGMTFTRELWNEIKKCGKNFCVFDDYNWDWTLQHLSSKCFKEKLKVLKMKASRVFHMGDCGVHHKGKNCNPKTKREEIEKILNNNKQYLFPNVVSLGGKSGVRLRDPKPNGGWGDVRDHQLCSSFLLGLNNTS